LHFPRRVPPPDHAPDSFDFFGPPKKLGRKPGHPIVFFASPNFAQVVAKTDENFCIMFRHSNDISKLADIVSGAYLD
jgi:hypothetical protein